MNSYDYVQQLDRFMKLAKQEITDLQEQLESFAWYLEGPIRQVRLFERDTTPG